MAMVPAVSAAEIPIIISAHLIISINIAAIIGCSSPPYRYNSPSRRKNWSRPAPPRCLDSESKGHLSVVKPIDEETLMGTGRPKGQEKRGHGTTEGISGQVPTEEKSEKDERAKMEQKNLETLENSANMLEFLKSCGWGTSGGGR